MKKDKKTQVAMADRLKWLNGWLRQRNYDIGDKRKSFIFFYYCALLPLYTPKEARGMTLEVNSRFAEPLDEYAINSIVRTVNSKRGYMQKNRTIIDTLGITPAEVEALQIGHNMAEQAEREQRRTQRQARSKSFPSTRRATGLWKLPKSVPMLALAPLSVCWPKQPDNRSKTATMRFFVWQGRGNLLPK